MLTIFVFTVETSCHKGSCGDSKDEADTGNQSADDFFGYHFGIDDLGETH